MQRKKICLLILYSEYEERSTSKYFVILYLKERRAPE